EVALRGRDMRCIRLFDTVVAPDPRIVDFQQRMSLRRLRRDKEHRSIASGKIDGNIRLFSRQAWSLASTIPPPSGMLSGASKPIHHILWQPPEWPYVWSIVFLPSPGHVQKPVYHINIEWPAVFKKVLNGHG